LIVFSKINKKDGYVKFVRFFDFYRRYPDKITKEFPNIYNTKRIICLYIEGEYDYTSLG